MKSLKEYRLAAGYKSAKAFAAEQGLGYQSYINYEREPQKIPMNRAWSLADALGVTIDQIVGRSEGFVATEPVEEVQVEVPAMAPETVPAPVAVDMQPEIKYVVEKTPLQAAADTLSVASRAMLNEYVEYLSYRDKAASDKLDSFDK